jgi:xanthine dehydrogenase accessory factor
MKDLWSAVFNSLKSGQPVMLATVLKGECPGDTGLYSKKGILLAGKDIGQSEDTGLITVGANTLFQQWFWPRPGLVIFGGGHVALPVAKIGHLLDFEVTVCDDRKEFANSQRFPQAKVLAMPYDQAFDQLALNSSHYVVIVTRGHSHDRACMVRALDTEAAYIGVIGSPKKARETTAWLQDQGYSHNQVQRIFSPIGLDIHAKTPEEIAVSILGEIIREKSNRPAHASIEEIAEALGNKAEDEGCCLITIVSSQGSTPQGAGARMVLKADGHTVGTIGGGLVEKMALDKALQIMSTQAPRLLEYNLDNTMAAQEGMICGGRMTVFIQPV